MISMNNLSENIKKKALEVGFVHCRITNALPVDNGPLLNWLEIGANGTMKWMERNPNARCDPKSLLPEAKTVLCFAYPYDENGLGVKENVRLERARFARAEDYHKVVKAKLKILDTEIKKFRPDAKTIFCVDTSPIMEKALAERAGLGWIGKNTLLINKNFGSWFVLGEILTDIEMTFDSPVENLCGACGKCIEACPTKALGEFTLRADRCISYLTIEHKGEVDAEYKSLIKKGTYGCDICQEICPYNKGGS